MVLVSVCISSPNSVLIMGQAARCIWVSRPEHAVHRPSESGSRAAVYRLRCCSLSHVTMSRGVQ